MTYQFYEGGSMMLPDYSELTEQQLVAKYPILRHRDIAIIQTSGGVLYGYDNLVAMCEMYNIDTTQFTTKEQQLAQLNTLINLSAIESVTVE